MNSLIDSQHPTARTVLVVDDEVLIATCMAMEFQEAGWNAICARDGRDGFEAFLAESPDLVITDFNMPEMNGRELAMRIRADNFIVPVILVSGESQHLRRETGVFTAAFDKPVDPFLVRQEGVRLLSEMHHEPGESFRCH